MSRPVAGIVLAAGRSSRMGRPKALLPIDDETFLERAIATLREGGCDPVVAVLPPGEGSGPMADRAEAAGARWIENPLEDAEQVDSLCVGLGAAGPDAAAAVVLPVDVALAGPEVVRSLIAAFRAREAPIVRPVHRGTPGHPVLFARSTWAELADPDLEAGARDVVRRHRDGIEEVPVDGRGVTVDVDTPEDYAREVGEP